MFQVVTSWIGIYLLIGLIPSLFNIKSIWNALDYDDDECSRLLALGFVMMFLWPIIPPLVLYLSIADRIIKRYVVKREKLFCDHIKLARFLANINAITEDFYYDAYDELENSKDKDVSKFKKRFGLE